MNEWAGAGRTLRSPQPDGARQAGRGLSLEEGLPTTPAAITPDGEFRSQGRGPLGVQISPPLLPSGGLGPLHLSVASACLHTAAEGGRERLFSLRRASRARDGRIVSPGCRPPASKSGSSYLRRYRGTFSTENLASAHAPPRASANCVCAVAERSARFPSSSAGRAGRTRRSAFLEGAGRARRSAAPGSARLRSGHCRSFKFGSPRFAQDVFADSVAAPSERSGLRSRVHGGRGIGDAPNAAGALPSRGARPQVKARRPAALAA